jgi:hypothetical protein
MLQELSICSLLSQVRSIGYDMSEKRKMKEEIRLWRREIYDKGKKALVELGYLKAE